MLFTLHPLLKFYYRNVCSLRAKHSILAFNFFSSSLQLCSPSPASCSACRSHSKNEMHVSDWGETSQWKLRNERDCKWHLHRKYVVSFGRRNELFSFNDKNNSHLWLAIYLLSLTSFCTSMLDINEFCFCSSFCAVPTSLSISHHSH